MNPETEAAALELARHATANQLADYEARLILAAYAKPPGEPPTAPERDRITVERLPADLMTRTLPPRRYSQYPYCPLRTAGTLVSEGGAGKSWLKLSMLLHIAAGLPFLGQ